MVLEPIEFMDDKYELKKLIKLYVDDTTKQLVQRFELMAGQLRGKLEAGGSRSFHHGETNKTIPFEEFYDFLNVYRHNNANGNSLRNNQQSTSRKETKEPPSFVGGEAEKTLHQEDWKSLPSDYEENEETSHENE